MDLAYPEDIFSPYTLMEAAGKRSASEMLEAMQVALKGIDVQKTQPWVLGCQAFPHHRRAAFEVHFFKGETGVMGETGGVVVELQHHAGDRDWFKMLFTRVAKDLGFDMLPFEECKPETNPGCGVAARWMGVSNPYMSERREAWIDVANICATYTDEAQTLLKQLLEDPGIQARFKLALAEKDENIQLCVRSTLRSLAKQQEEGSKVSAMFEMQ